MNHIHTGGLRRRVAAGLHTGWPYPVVTAAIAIANSLYLSGYAQLNPYITRSYLSSHVVRGALPGDYTIDHNDGVTAQALGIQAIHQLLHGAIPWWNPHEGLGMPMVGEMQSAALFPLLSLQALPAGFLIYHLVLELIAGLATVKLCTTLELSRPAAVVAGCLFALNGSLVWILNAASIPVAFLPLLLLGIERAFRSSQSGTRRGFITIGIAGWLTITAGFPEGTYLNFGLALAYALWRFCGASGLRRRFVARLAGGSALGLTLSLPVLLAFAAYLRNGANVGPHSGILAHAALPLGTMGMTFTPYAYGPIFALHDPDVSFAWDVSGGYTTIAVLFVAVLGALGTRYRGLRIICAAWVLLAFGKAYDVDGITAVLNHVPEIPDIAVYRYLYATVAMSVVMLVALAIDDVVRRQLQRWQFAVAAAIALGTLVFAWSRAHVLTRSLLHKPHVAALAVRQLRLGRPVDRDRGHRPDRGGQTTSLGPRGQLRPALRRGRRHVLHSVAVSTARIHHRRGVDGVPQPSGHPGQERFGPGPHVLHRTDPSPELRRVLRRHVHQRQRLADSGAVGELRTHPAQPGRPVVAPGDPAGVLAPHCRRQHTGRVPGSLPQPLSAPGRLPRRRGGVRHRAAGRAHPALPGHHAAAPTRHRDHQHLRARRSQAVRGHALAGLHGPPSFGPRLRRPVRGAVDAHQAGARLQRLESPGQQQVGRDLGLRRGVPGGSGAPGRQHGDLLVCAAWGDTLARPVGRGPAVHGRGADLAAGRGPARPAAGDAAGTGW